MPSLFLFTLNIYIDAKPGILSRTKTAHNILKETPLINILSQK